MADRGANKDEGGDGAPGTGRPRQRRGAPRPAPPEAARRRPSPADPARDRRRADAGPESTLRGLVGSGPSRVGPVAAMRARDVARPRPEDLERAERDLVIRRREEPPAAGGRTAGAPTGRPTKGRRK